MAESGQPEIVRVVPRILALVIVLGSAVVGVVVVVRTDLLAIPWYLGVFLGGIAGSVLGGILLGLVAGAYGRRAARQ